MRLLLLLAAAGCTAGPIDTGSTTSTDTTKTGTTPTDTDTTTDTTTDTETDTDTGPAEGSMSIAGNVRLQLYVENEAGDISYVDWEDYYSTYPFGQVFVGTYADTGAGQDWLASTNFSSPNLVDGDDFSFSVTGTVGEELRVFAAVDATIVDSVIATYEPSGVWPDGIPVVEGAAVEGVNITILVPYTGGGSGTGGDDDSSATPDYANISGEISVTDPWVDGDVAAMLYTTDGQGPYESARVTPTAISGGAEASYNFDVTMSSGEMSLLGAWDSNGNGIFDPADTWGSLVAVGGGDGNPITVGLADLIHQDVLIPFGDTNPSFVPYVILSGTLRSFDDVSAWPATATVHVAAMKYKPNLEFTVSSLENDAYDYQSFPITDFITGELDYWLVTPSGTVTFVWAYVDMDGDGILQEVGEPIGAFGGGSGRTATGRASQPDLDIDVAAPG